MHTSSFAIASMPAIDLRAKACPRNFVHGEFALMECQMQAVRTRAGALTLSTSRRRPASTLAQCDHRHRGGQIRHSSGKGVRSSSHPGECPMFRRILFELARVFVPAQQGTELPSIDVPSGALNEATTGGESGLSRLRDCAATRSARSRRRVWRPREVRRVARPLAPATFELVARGRLAAVLENEARECRGR